jgi:7-cyano-7-deazaguanine synthase in queuosine biosynthesis
VQFPYKEAVPSITGELIPKHNRELIGIGGGKDSVVVWERWKKDNKNAEGLVIHTQHRHAIINTLTKEMGIPHIEVERSMDESFFDPSRKWNYNGHVPVSMIYAWIGILAAYLYNYDAFIASNEKSAEEANTELFGMNINHQWSKTKEFEDLFNAYIHTHISPDLKYYSPLRDMTELQIVEELVNIYPQYLPHIASCNRNFSIQKPLQGKKWCGTCPKCAFAFLMFAAYLPKQEVVTMFGKDMLADVSLEPVFRDLGGRGGLKPFECVGTFAEVQEAFRRIQARGEFIIPSSLST